MSKFITGVFTTNDVISKPLGLETKEGETKDSNIYPESMEKFLQTWITTGQTVITKRQIEKLSQTYNVLVSTIVSDLFNRLSELERKNNERYLNILKVLDERIETLDQRSIGLLDNIGMQLFNQWTPIHTKHINKGTLETNYHPLYGIQVISTDIESKDESNEGQEQRTGFNPSTDVPDNSQTLQTYKNMVSEELHESNKRRTELTEDGCECIPRWYLTKEEYDSHGRHNIETAVINVANCKDSSERVDAKIRTGTSSETIVNVTTVNPVSTSIHDSVVNNPNDSLNNQLPESSFQTGPGGSGEGQGQGQGQGQGHSEDSSAIALLLDLGLKDEDIDNIVSIKEAYKSVNPRIVKYIPPFAMEIE